MPSAQVRLGKQDYKHDARTLRLARYVQDAVVVPSHFNYDAHKAPFPMHMFGNDQYGDCVIAARANAQMRLERIEQRRTIKISDDDAINEYKKLTGCQQPEDPNDTGLVMLDAMREWRNSGWSAAGKNYKISAFGELDAGNLEELHASIYLLHGVHFGFALPTAIKGRSEWDYNGETGPEWRPGSWGGHCVLGIAYDATAITVISWGEKIRVNNAFIERYADEAWGVVDALDSWDLKHKIDVNALTTDLQKIARTVNP